MPERLDRLLDQAARARREHRLGDAKRDLDEAFEICLASARNCDLARTLKALGQIERDLEHPEIALRRYQEALAIYKNEEDALALAHALRHVADIQQELGQLEPAALNYREALAIYRMHPEASKLDLANAIRGLAILTSDTGENDEAKLLWQEAHELYAAVHVQPGVEESSRRLRLLHSR